MIKTQLILLLFLALVGCNRKYSAEYEERAVVTSVSHQPGYNTVSTSVDGDGHVSINTTWVDDTWDATLQTEHGINASTSGSVAEKIIRNFNVGQTLFVKYQKGYSVDKLKDGSEKLTLVTYTVLDVSNESFEIPREEQ